MQGQPFLIGNTGDIGAVIRITRGGVNVISIPGKRQGADFTETTAASGY